MFFVKSNRWLTISAEVIVVKVAYVRLHNNEMHPSSKDSLSTLVTIGDCSVEVVNNQTT
jgi:hypothetical protein